MRARPLLLGILAAGAVATLAWAGITPIQSSSRDATFDIPHGTYARRRAGEDLPILPDRIRLTLGVRDTLVLRNQDDVPQIFGPTLMMPGQSFRLPFEQAAEYQFACSAHASGQMTIIVEPNPRTVPARILWRARALMHELR